MKCWETMISSPLRPFMAHVGWVTRPEAKTDRLQEFNCEFLWPGAVDRSTKTAPRRLRSYGYSGQDCMDISGVSCSRLLPEYKPSIDGAARSCESPHGKNTRHLHPNYYLLPVPHLRSPLSRTRWLPISTGCGRELVRVRRLMRQNLFGPWPRSCRPRRVERLFWISNHGTQSCASRSLTT